MSNEKRVQIKFVGSYGGHSVSQNGSLTITLAAEYSELAEYIQSIQMLNNDVKVEVTKPGEKQTKLGVFRINGINISGDGSAKIKINTLVDYAEIGNVDSIIPSEKGEQFKILFDSLIELEEEEEDVEDSWDEEEDDNEEDWD